MVCYLVTPNLHLDEVILHGITIGFPAPFHVSREEVHCQGVPCVQKLLQTFVHLGHSTTTIDFSYSFRSYYLHRFPHFSHVVAVIIFFQFHCLLLWDIFFSSMKPILCFMNCGLL